MIPAIFGLTGIGSFIGFALGIGLGIHSGIKSAFEADSIDMINNSGVITYEQYKERQKEVTKDLLISGRSNPKGNWISYLKNFFSKDVLSVILDYRISDDNVTKHDSFFKKLKIVCFYMLPALGIVIGLAHALYRASDKYAIDHCSDYDINEGKGGYLKYKEHMRLTMEGFAKLGEIKSKKGESISIDCLSKELSNEITIFFDNCDRAEDEKKEEIKTIRNKCLNKVNKFVIEDDSIDIGTPPRPPNPITVVSTSPSTLLPRSDSKGEIILFGMPSNALEILPDTQHSAPSIAP